MQDNLVEFKAFVGGEPVLVRGSTVSATWPASGGGTYILLGSKELADGTQLRVAETPEKVRDLLESAAS